MTFYGLHIIDIAIVVGYLALMLYIGKLFSKTVHDQQDFFLAGRKLGRVIQFFLNFGNMTDANSAASTSSVVYQNGISGIWLSLTGVFITPYYWFMNPWFRRARLITMADLFEERFGGKLLPGLYAVVTIFISILMMGAGFLISERVMEAMLIKPESAYTQNDKQQIAAYQEYKELEQAALQGTLSENDKPRYLELGNLQRAGELKAYVSYVKPVGFYILYAAVIGVYIVLGGFAAAAITDAFQGILIIIFSIILIPFGLSRLGGFSGLHEKVPDFMFDLWGKGAVSEYSALSIVAIMLVSWLAVHAAVGNMAISGSAKDEMAARLGAVCGGFTKRLMIVGWGMCGLIAIALYSGQISDPDTSWGVLSSNLLFTGAIGLMLAGILAANMSTLDAAAIQISALFVRNIYANFARGHSEKRDVYIGRIVIAVVLVLGVLVAMYAATGVVALLKMFLSIGVIFGSPIALLFMWSRLTRTAVIIEVLVLMVLLIIVPAVVQTVPSLRQNELLTAMTTEKYVTVEDVSGSREVYSAPVSLYFDTIGYKEVEDVKIPQGVGRFNIEILLAKACGINVEKFNSAGLLACRFFVDAILPFVILFPVSLLTGHRDPRAVAEFYAKLKTPVAATPELDLIEVEKSRKDPSRFDHKKMFRNTCWEFTKFDKADFWGTVFCLLAVLFIIKAALWLFSFRGN